MADTVGEENGESLTQETFIGRRGFGDCLQQLSLLLRSSFECVTDAGSFASD